VFDKTLSENYYSEHLFSLFLNLKNLIMEREIKDLKFLPHYFIIQYLKLLGVYSEAGSSSDFEVSKAPNLSKFFQKQIEVLEDLDDFSLLHKRERKSLLYQLMTLLEEQVDVRGKIISHEIFEKIF
uniref:hypothetical protein n=1 Tax=Breoghania sp. TaxID=2065378 RepID=UPI00261BB4FA